MNVWSKVVEALVLEPIFGFHPWSAQSTCLHVHPNGPIPKYSRCCCMACNKSGKDGHPDLRESAEGRLRLKDWHPETKDGRDDWSPPTDLPEPTKYAGPLRNEPKPTRKQKRKALYGTKPEAAYPIDPMDRGFIPPMDPAEIDRILEPTLAKSN